MISATFLRILAEANQRQLKTYSNEFILSRYEELSREFWAFGEKEDISLKNILVKTYFKVGKEVLRRMG